MKKIKSYLILMLWGLLLLGGSFACKKTDPCESKTCLNGGTCDSGNCNCTERWTGETCGTQKTPTSIKLTKLELTKYPAKTTTGGNWDPSDGPDVYMKIYKGTTLIWTGPVFPLPLDPVSGQNPVFFPATKPELTSPAEEYTIELWDKDSAPDTDDFMGGLKFKAYTETNNFPESLRIECTGCSTGYKVDLEYIF